MSTRSVDAEEIFSRVKSSWRLDGARVLVTGAGGFLGYYYSNFLLTYFKELNLELLVLADLQDLEPRFGSDASKNAIKMIQADLSDPSQLARMDFGFDVIINLASFASPVAYRADPKATLKGSVLTVWKLLEHFERNGGTKGGFQIFSSSEIYGDPPADQIPTNEFYRGNVSCLGPRACYDESKRFIETLGSVFSANNNLNVSIVRPFNNFGPGMSLDDGRLPADVMNAIISDRTLSIFSDGSPTRSFCYVADAIVGYILALNQIGLSVYNIGNDSEEISVRNFVERAATVCNQKLGRPLNFEFTVSADTNFLTDNPNRRMPDLTKARNELGFSPSITLDEGLARWLTFENEKLFS